MVQLKRPDTPADWNDARRLVEAYAASLGLDLSFQNFTDEIEHLSTELANGIVTLGRELGYTRLVLDTLPSMGEAQALYLSLGFQPIAPYRFNPVPGTAFLELHLR